jgi:transposase
MTDWKMYGQIQEHKRKGFNKSQTARLLGKDYKTVLKYWDMTADEFAAEKENAGLRIKKAEPYEDYVVECLRRYPDMSSAQLYDWILEQNNGIKLSFKERSFRSYVSHIREEYDISKTIKARQYEAVDDPPMGEQAQVDMGEIIMETATGKHKKAYCFAMVMSNSRQKFVYWLDKPFTTDTFIKAHNKAFAFFGGRTKEIVYDQDKVLAVSENNGDIIYTEQFQAYISIVKFNIYLCRGSDPESKGRIEAVVKYVKYGFAKHRIFHDIETLNDKCIAWLNRTANAKVHETTKKIPAEVFALEQQYLIPVAEMNNKYSVNTNIPYPVRKDNIVLFKSNRYRVPKGTYEPKKMVYMIVENETVTITDKETGEIYARHPLCNEKGRLIGQKRDRDYSRTQEQLEENILAMLGGSEPAKQLLIGIHKEKPRYYRDQLGVIKNICLKLTDTLLIESAISYCIERNLYSAGDFKSAMVYLNELNITSERVAPIVKLPGLPEKYRNMSPEIRDLSAYEDAMRGSVING